MIKHISIYTLAWVCSCGLWGASKAAVAMDAIEIAVQVDGSVSVTHHVEATDGGIQILDIQFTNTDDRVLTVDSVEVSIPIAERLSGDMEILFGGSDMGRTPLLRQRIDALDDKSYSSIFEMIRFSEGKYLLAGSLTWRVFLPRFTIRENNFVVWSDGEGKQIVPGETVQYERIVLRRSSDWIELLDAFGDAIAYENGVERLKDVSFEGWATWDYYGKGFSNEDIFGNMRELDAISGDANLIQIDGGWWTARGDYTSVRSDLQGGIKSIADRIEAQGKIPGLHFDGFRADATSDICREHPEYFLRDQNDELIVDKRENHDGSLHHVFFDYSHPGARAYISECVRTMKEEWGIRYFKVDFMRYGLEQDLKKRVPSVEKIKAHDPSLTGVERFRLGMRAIRDAIGNDNYFLGCSAVFGPCIGFVDGMRTGGDVHPVYEAFPQRCLANAGNFYLAGKVFNGDGDYLVFRAAEDEDSKVVKAKHKYGGTLTLNEAKMWADFSTLYGRSRLQSDNLMSLRPERKAIVSEVLSWPFMDDTVPLDVWRRAGDKDDGFELLLARSGGQIYLGVFNWSEEDREYDLRDFGKGGCLVLGPRQSKILRYSGNSSFDALSAILRVN